MLIRLLIFSILGALVYRAIKSWMGIGQQPERESVTAQPPGHVDDVMIKDLVCGIYFPRRNAVVLRQDNKEHYFCGTACRDNYLAQRSRDQATQGSVK